MVKEEINKKSLVLNYTVIKEGKDTKQKQTFSEIKPTSSIESIYNSGKALKSLLITPLGDIEKIDVYTLYEE